VAQRHHTDQPRELARVQGDYGRHPMLRGKSDAAPRRRRQVIHGNRASRLGSDAQDRGQYDQAKTIHMESLVLCRALGSKRGIAMCLEKLAGIAVARCQPERAARLLGTTEALRQAITAPMGAADRADYERFVALAHADWTITRLQPRGQRTLDDDGAGHRICAVRCELMRSDTKHC